MKCCATVLTYLLLAGCAGAPPTTPQLFSDAAFRPSTEHIGADDLFALNPEMRAYLDSPPFRTLVRVKGKERGLFDALYAKGELKIDYNSATTRNAGDTFQARSGNCLSLVIMTAAFAKALGLDTRYQSVAVAETWSRESGLDLASAHVNLRLGPRIDNREIYVAPENALTIDFLPPKDMASYHAYPIAESALVAMYMNNRAIEAMLADRLDDAYWWARGAVTANPASVVAYNTLGVIYQRHGDGQMAERSFRLALEREPNNIMVMRNLAPVLAALGKHAESQALGLRADAIEPEPPFHFFDLGKAAMARADYQAAKALFAREVKRAPYYDEFHLWLGLAHLQLGESAQAREQIALALKTSTTRDGRERYSAKLEHLRAQGR